MNICYFCKKTITFSICYLCENGNIKNPQTFYYSNINTPILAHFTIIIAEKKFWFRLNINPSLAGFLIPDNTTDIFLYGPSNFQCDNLNYEHVANIQGISANMFNAKRIINLLGFI